MSAGSTGSIFFWLILGYLGLLLSISIRKAFFVKSQDDFMVAGRAVPTHRLVGTLLCTWIGSGSLLAGAGLAARVGFSELWMAAGAWIGIAIIFFIAAKVRRIAEYTVPDILELRYNKYARILGMMTIVIAYTTIAGYQFRGGGFVLELVTGMDRGTGILLTAAFIITFTAFAGMMSIVAVDVINGAVITLAVLVAVPVVFFNIGGAEHLTATLPASHFTVFGDHNFLWAMGIFLPVMLLLLGESTIYQKFFSARSDKAAKSAVIWWIIGTIIVETAIASLAIFANSHFQLVETETIILHTAVNHGEVGLPLAGGLLLICAAVAIITSTGNSFLLGPSTNLTRDVYQRFINPDAPQARVVLVQRICVVALGALAYTMLTQFSTVLAMALTAYTMIGAGITPALLAAFLWKRVTVQGGVASMATGMGVTLGITIANNVFERMGIRDGQLLSEEFLILPAAGASVAALIIVSLLTRPSPPEKWRRFYLEETSLAEAIRVTQTGQEE